MLDLSLFTLCEAVELILGFYTFTSGFWQDELDDIPEAKRFVEMGLTQADEEYPDLQVLNAQGAAVLHEYIKFISDSFIKYMKKNGLEDTRRATAKWFHQELNLQSEEDAEEIAEYICSNLHHYGYEVRKSYSRHKEELYRLEKCL